MRQSIDISLARFLMLFSMLLLGVLEYLWLHNEYVNKYRDMEDKINHVMFSSIRDVEDSLIFSKIASGPLKFRQDGQDITLNILGSKEDSTVQLMGCDKETEIISRDVRIRARHPMRGILLQTLSADSSGIDTAAASVSAMVMHRIRTTDSTGEFSGYEIFSWQGTDTAISGLVSKPQFDVLAGKRMALTNEHYKADLFHDLLPHISFALFLWVMVGAAFYYIWRNLRKQMQLNALRDEFVSNITHELKTPITTVGVALESLHMSQDMRTTQGQRYLDISRSELKRLSLLVDRILTNHAPQLQYEKLDVSKIVEDVVHHMKVQFDDKKALVQVDQHGESFIIEGDKSHLSGVLYNLLENALKYSEGRPDIVIHLTRENGTVHLAVEDKGIGIDPGYHDKIFEKLFRVPHHNRHDVKGHGLGLSYVADVVKQHHGKIEVKSEPGKGSVFSLSLPAMHEN